MGVTKYAADGRAWWRVDEWLLKPDGTFHRFRKKRIPTKEQAQMLAAKVKAESFEGRYFERVRPSSLTVAQAWEKYAPITKRDNDSWKADFTRAKRLVKHLGNVRAAQLNATHIDAYRTARLAERTRRGTAPSPASLDHEVKLLKRLLSYAVECKQLPDNPLAKVGLLRKPNVRMRVLTDEEFQRLSDASPGWLRPILAVAITTGMRKQEILNLQWSQVDLKRATLTLPPQSTKEERPRLVLLTPEVVELLRQLPTRFSEYVFQSPKPKVRGTGPRENVKRTFERVRDEVGLSDVWFHDLRRTFITNARRLGIPESVVMRMSGHRTREVFERYNVVSEEDLRTAAALIHEKRAAFLGHFLDTVQSEQKNARATESENSIAPGGS